MNGLGQLGMRKFLIRLTGAMLLAGSASATPAATLITNSGGLLTGATGVSVHGSLYNVEFVDGTCASVFGSCSTSSFTFQSQATAQLATQALLDQVLLGIYDDDVELTLGCPVVSDRSGCIIGIPYFATATTYDTAFTQNRSNLMEASGRFDSSTFRVINQAHSYTTVGRGGEVFARFTFTGLVPAVPEPSTWTMMLIGFGAIGHAMRRRKQAERYPKTA